MINVILLNGPSSAGKSTLARELKKRFTQAGAESVIISIDDYMVTDPKETIYEDDIYDIMPGMCQDMRAAFLDGKKVIVDHAITSERIYELFREAAKDAEVLKVKVVCDLETLRERERMRGDRCPGSAEASFEYLWPQEGYDLCIDSGRHSVAESAEIIWKRVFGIAHNVVEENATDMREDVMIRLQKVEAKDKELLFSVNQKYLYEMTNFYDDEMDEFGNYHYGHFEEYFTDPKRIAYFIRTNETLVGFAMLCPYSNLGTVRAEAQKEIRDESKGSLPSLLGRDTDNTLLGADTDFVMAEFTIFPAYRRKHYALDAANEILLEHPGKWEIKYNEKNQKAKKLWTTVTAPYHPEVYHLNAEETVFVFRVTR